MLSGPATQDLMQRALLVPSTSSGQASGAPARLASISVAPFYYLRSAAGYRARCRQWAKTRLIGATIAEPRNRTAAPGYLRIDSVHRGEEDGGKEVYHINAVDCVTQ